MKSILHFAPRLFAVFAMAMVLAGCVGVLPLPGGSDESGKISITYNATVRPVQDVQREANEYCDKNLNQRAALHSSVAIGPTPYDRRDDYDCVEK